MRERFEATWAERVHRARTWQAGDDPEPVLEALGQAVVRHLVGALEEVPAEERQALEAVAGPAMAAARERALADPDEREGWLGSVAMAALGLRLLQGEPAGDLSAIPRDLRRPTPRRLTAALDGRLDGLSAASCALWYLVHGAGEARMIWSMVGGAEPADADERPILVAAAEPAPMRPPREGRPIATRSDPDVEAVWFAAERELALYAREEVYVALTAQGVTTRDLRPGYWLGSVDAGVGPELGASLKVGDRVVPWRLQLEG
jgi:hypothetical protein